MSKVRVPNPVIKPFKVRVGSIWMSNDPRQAGSYALQRAFKVIEIEGTQAVVEGIATGLRRRIRLNRFNNSVRGYVRLAGRAT